MWIADVEAMMAAKSTTQNRAKLVSGDPLPTGGTSSAYTLTTNEALPVTTPEFDQVIRFVTHRTSAGSATLAIDGGAAYPLRSKDGRAPAFLLVAGKSYEAWFDGRVWVLPFDSSTAVWNQNEATFNRQALAEERKATEHLPGRRNLTGQALTEEIRDAIRTAIKENPSETTSGKGQYSLAMKILWQRGIETNGGLGVHVEKVTDELEFRSKRGPRGVTKKSTAAKRKSRM